MLADGFFTRLGLAEAFRWLHILAGITWIGLLYFFNLVQVPAYAAFGDEGRARNIALDKVTRRALWWFRWAAAATVVMGIFIIGATKDYFGNGFSKSGKGLTISLGMLLGIIMFLNVWGVIWRNQKVVLANAANLVAGGEANPDAPAAGRRAFMASRQNVVFSVPMVFLMVFAGHSDTTYTAIDLSGAKVAGFWIIALIVVAVLEVNALGLMPWKAQANKGLNMIYDGKGVQNPLIASAGLWVIVLVICEVFLKS